MRHQIPAACCSSKNHNTLSIPQLHMSDVVKSWVLMSSIPLVRTQTHTCECVYSTFLLAPENMILSHSGRIIWSRYVNHMQHACWFGGGQMSCHHRSSCDTVASEQDKIAQHLKIISLNGPHIGCEGVLCSFEDLVEVRGDLESTKFNLWNLMKWYSVKYFFGRSHHYYVTLQLFKRSFL